MKPTEKPWVHPIYPSTNSTVTPKPAITTTPLTIPSTTPIQTTATTQKPTTSKPPPTTTTATPTTTVIPQQPSPTHPPTPDLDLDEDYFPFPAPFFPLEDIDLPAGPPAILRPDLRSSTDLSYPMVRLYRYRYSYPLASYPAIWYNSVVNNYI
jgi:hypothetical protein